MSWIVNINMKNPILHNLQPVEISTLKKLVCYIKNCIAHITVFTVFCTFFFFYDLLIKRKPLLWVNWTLIFNNCEQSNGQWVPNSYPCKFIFIDIINLTKMLTTKNCVAGGTLAFCQNIFYRIVLEKLSLCNVNIYTAVM